MPHGIALFCPIQHRSCSSAGAIQYRSCGSAGATLHLCASTPHAPSFSIRIADAPLLSDNRPEPTHPHPMYRVGLRTPLCRQTFPLNLHVVNFPYTTNDVLAYAEVLFHLKLLHKCIELPKAVNPFMRLLRDPSL